MQINTSKAMFHNYVLHVLQLTGDQMVLYYGFAHRSIKWWKRVLFHLLDVFGEQSHPLQGCHLLQNHTAGVQTGCG